MCYVNSRNYLLAAACALALSFCGAMTAQAEIINVTYSLTGSGGGDPLNPPLIGNATGSLLPLGNVTWSDMIFPNLATGAGDGTFKMTFTDGDTLFGTASLRGDFSTVSDRTFHTTPDGDRRHRCALLLPRNTHRSRAFESTRRHVHIIRLRNTRHGSGTRVDRLVRDRTGELARIPKARPPISARSLETLRFLLNNRKPALVQVQARRHLKKPSKFACQAPKPQNPLPANNIPLAFKLGPICYS